MKVLKWFCFILACLDVLGYIIEKADNISRKQKTSSKLGGCMGLCFGVAARVYVLYGACAYWLLA